MDPVAEPLQCHVTALAAAVRQLAAGQYLTVDTQGWQRCTDELGEPPEVLARGPQLADVGRVSELWVRKPRFVRAGVLVEPSGEEWYRCERCEGTGVSPVPRACICTMAGPGRARPSVPSTRLDPELVEHRRELASRAIPDCTRCDGVGFAAVECFPCVGVGFFAAAVPVTLTGPGGVATAVLTPELAARYLGELDGVPAVDAGAMMRDLVDQVCDLGDEVIVSGADPGSACTMTGRWGVLELGEISVASWFGSEFAALGGSVETTFTVEPLPPLSQLLGEMLERCGEGRRLGFSREELASGEWGIVVWGCDETGARQLELGLDWEPIDALVSAWDLLARGELPPPRA